MTSVELQAVCRRFASVVAVDRVTLAIPSRQITALVGPSGCGKTTTLRLIGGLERPDAGKIMIDGRDMTAMSAQHRPTAMVFQGYALWPHKTVAGNIAFGLRVRGLGQQEIREKVRAVLALVGLHGIDDRLPGQLSGGQRQRVAIARALACEPSVLLLDEPLSNLDAELRLRVREELGALQRRLGFTAVLVTHDREEALSLADQIAVLNAGAIEQVGTSTELYLRPKTAFVAGFIGRRSFLPGKVARASGLEAVFDVGGSTIGVQQPCRLPIGASVRLALRTERLHLCDQSDNAIAATFQGMSFRGACYRLILSIGGNRIELDVSDIPNNFRIGAPCYVHAPPDAIQMFPE